MTGKEEDVRGPMAPSVEHVEVKGKRQRIAGQLDHLARRRLGLVEERGGKIREIERRRAEVAEIDAKLKTCGTERGELIAMDDALAEEQRALERILIRRSGR